MCDRIKNILTLTVVVAALGLAGCASTEEIKRLSADVAKAQATADAAMNKANDADAKATNALKMANEAGMKATAAQAMASDAKKAAQDAMAASKETEEKCNRMFQKSLRK